MTPKKNKEKKYRRHRHLGSWYQAGRIIIIIGGVLAIIAAVLDLIDFATGSDVWDSYTFGQLGIAYLGPIIAIVCGALLLWMIVDPRFVQSMHLVLFAILIIVIALLAGNIGGLVCIIGAILIIFEQISRS